MELCKSDSIKELATALNKAQAVMEGAKKTALNPHFKSKYANLEAVWEAIRKPMTDQGLSIVQFPGKSELGHFLETTLMHTSGEFMSGRMFIAPSKDDPQGVGSAITYARRFSLMAVLGIAPEDDDGEGAMGRGHGKPTPLTTQKIEEVIPAPGSWKHFEVFLGEHKGKELGQLTDEQIEPLYTKYGFEGSPTTKQGKEFQLALLAWKSETPF